MLDSDSRARFSSSIVVVVPSIHAGVIVDVLGFVQEWSVIIYSLCQESQIITFEQQLITKWVVLSQTQATML